jgi:hypothetical protein
VVDAEKAEGAGAGAAEDAADCVTYSAEWPARRPDTTQPLRRQALRTHPGHRARGHRDRAAG